MTADRKGYAEVSVNAPFRQAFSYGIPPHLEVVPGHAVWVPFGARVLQGIVLETGPTPQYPETRDIEGLVEPEPLVDAARIAVARWISGYYLSPLFASVALMLPPAFERDPVTLVRLSAAQHDRSSLSNDQIALVSLLDDRGEMRLKDLHKALGRNPDRLVAALVRRGFIEKRYEPEPVKVRAKEAVFLVLATPAEVAAQAASELPERSAKQAQLLRLLVRLGELPLADARARTGCTPQTVKTLAGRGLIRTETRRVDREPFRFEGISPSSALTFTPDQARAFQAISVSLAQPDTNGQPGVFLLHGVTGSGKTEVYLQALAEARRLGKRGIVLVPEISLTPQTIERFAARFPGGVGVIHSRLSTGEQFDQWWRTKKGEFDVVIGARSAVFAPQPDLGLIVMDEEHEWTYKQEDTPRYHAREVALKMAELSGATVVLGSATPDIESYYRAQSGRYRLLELPERIGQPMPRVEVVDLRDELESGNRSVFSRSLSAGIAQALSRHEQVILFLNRRGTATFVQCRKCGFVLKCPSCEVPLTLHEDEGLLVCHRCNFRRPPPLICPICSSHRIKFMGLGTQKLEREVQTYFPRARTLRWDSDTTRQKGSHEEIMARFRDHKADVLVGTQMVAKGLDLPLVTVVGIVNADTSLNLPDFRAAERTFQLLTQAAGRAGRGTAGGRVVIQTFSPHHYAVRAASGHDYALFSARELENRRSINQPPFTQLALLTCTNRSDTYCREMADGLKKVLTDEMGRRDVGGIEIMGPAPAFVHRVKAGYRWQLVLRGTAISGFLSEVRFPKGWAVDIDPVSLL